MRVLLVNDNYSARGGVEHYLQATADLLSRHGHATAVLCRQPTAESGPESGWRVHHMPGPGTGSDIALRAVIDQERPDVAYLHQVSSADSIASVGRLLPVVAYIHNFEAVCAGMAKLFRQTDRVCDRALGWGCFPVNYLRRCSHACRPRTVARLIVRALSLRRAYQALDHVFVASDYMRELLLQNGFRSDRVSRLAPHFLAGDAPSVSQPPGDPDAILFAGRLEREKGLAYLLRAVALLSGYARLVVAGNGTLRHKYEHMVHELGLQDRVDFLGWLTESDMADAYARCALVVIPSIWPEPFAKVGIEALAHGRPVVAFDVGGIHDWLSDGENGFLVPPRDVAALAARIGQLLADPGTASAMGRAGQRRVLATYTAERHADALLSVFRSVHSRDLPSSEPMEGDK